MPLLGYATAAATTAGSYAFAAASSYVFRPEAEGSEAAADLPSAGPSRRRPRATASEPDTSTTAESKATSNANKRLSLRLEEPHPRLPSAVAFAGPPGGMPRGEAEELVDQINMEENLYRILGVKRRADAEEIRRAFLNRSKLIHPDKLPFYAPSTSAFQRLSFAYETLSKPTSRRMYDLRGAKGYNPAKANTGGPSAPDETLHSVLRNVVREFLSGDFEMIRVFVTALNESNPGLDVGDETVENVEGVFRRLRELLLASQRCLRLIKFELIRLYEIQQALGSLSYFDLYGRLRLTLALTRVTLEIPMVLDRAMRDELPPTSPKRPSAGDGAQSSAAFDSRSERAQSSGGGKVDGDAGTVERRGLLGVKTRGMLVLTCKMLERAERWTGTPTPTPQAVRS